MRTRCPAPVLNTPHWKKVFCYPMPLDEQKLLRPVEMVLLKGSLVEVVDAYDAHIVKVKTNEYSGHELYMDDRFLEPALDGLERKKECPSLEEFLDKLKKYPKVPYIWGGNFTQGIPELAEYYPMPKEIDPFTKKVWTLQGVDCSGLLYEATGGFLPRNTSELIEVGAPVPIAGKTPNEIAKLLQPADLIVWKGHVIIVEDSGITFESAATFGGTARCNLLARLKSLEIPFVVRRWI
jgi:hypothetical protein